MRGPIPHFLPLNFEIKMVVIHCRVLHNINVKSKNALVMKDTVSVHDHIIKKLFDLVNMQNMWYHGERVIISQIILLSLSHEGCQLRELPSKNQLWKLSIQIDQIYHKIYQKVKLELQYHSMLLWCIVLLLNHKANQLQCVIIIHTAPNLDQVKFVIVWQYHDKFYFFTY